ncbi:GH25 family lysozyme [Streptomyces atratus]
MPQTSPVRVRVALTGTVVGAVLVALGVIAPAVEAAPPSSYGVSGADTSHYNHETAIDWNRVAVSNSFAFLKATQGVSSKDDWFARDYAAAARTSLFRAPYHFFPRYVLRGPARGPLASGPGMTVSPCRTDDLGGGVTGPGRCRRRR